MKVLVLSDIHDHVDNLRKIKESTAGVVDAVVFCGDLCAPFTAELLGSFDMPIYACLGNNDEDHIGLAKKGGENIVWTHLSQEFGEVVLDNKKIAFCHYPRLAEMLAQSGQYNAVFHGHTHVVREERYGKTVLVNPGSVCGIINGSYADSSYAIYDTNLDTLEMRSF